jgi:import inner membrane translocase subunit TIM44
MKKNYEASDNIIIAYARAFTDHVGSFFDENEMGQALRQLKMIDPRFNLEEFMRDAREFIIPEVMEAYLKGDANTLKEWCSDATYSYLVHGIKEQMQEGLISDSRVLDIRNVELVSAQILENFDVPVLIISYNTQEVIVFRNRLTNEIKYGREDQIDYNSYVCVFAKQENSLADPLTKGWKIMEVVKRRSQW